jgi:hypothetical protein
MKSLILVDGMNISNRSYAAKQIGARFDKNEVEVFDCSASTPPHLYVQMMMVAFKGEKHVIIENSWFGDRALGAMGQDMSISDEKKRMLDRIALGCNAQVAYCCADTNTYAINTNKLFPNSFQQYGSTIESMDNVWNNLDFKGLKVSRIDMRDGGYILDIDLLMDRTELFSGTNPGVGIGNWNPGQVILIIGDRHGPTTQPYKTDVNLAFCDMAKVGSSYWLASQLEIANIQENQLYWINAFDQFEMPTNHKFMDVLKPKAVLALGDSAIKWCDKNNIKFEGFQHPQYHKRFHYNEAYPLIQRLKELTE